MVIDIDIGGLWANVEYDLVRPVVIAVAVATGLNVVAGLAFRWITTRIQYVILWCTVFLMVFIVIVFTKPIASPQLVIQDVTTFLTGKPIETTNIPDNSSRFIVIMGIANTGIMPSVIKNYGFSLDVDGTTYNAERYTLPDSLTLPLAGRQVTYFSKDSLQEKTLTPLATGGYIIGITLFVVKEISFERLVHRKFTYTLSFEDVLGRTYSKTYPLNIENQEPKQIPGITQVIK
jgi:hypothetical protein